MPELLSISPQAMALAASMPHAIWRGNQLASYQAHSVPSGRAELDQELPQKGWPSAVLIELLLQQNGINEICLLRPALQAISTKRRIALIQPPHLPQIAAWMNWELPAEHLIWIKAKSTSDALWSAEQVLRNGSCGALLFWQMQSRPEALRRLHLAAQDTDTLFWMMRPLAAAQDASPSPLRLGLRPCLHGIEIDFIKRRGARREEPLLLQLQNKPATFSHSSISHHAFLDQPASSASVARGIPAELV